MAQQPSSEREPHGRSRGQETASEPQLPVAAGPVASDMLEVDVVVEDERWRSLDGLDAAIATACARAYAVGAMAPGRPAGIAVALLDDAAVAALNLQFRGKPKATNVLSFPAAADRAPILGDGAGDIGLGDIVLAYDTVQSEAREAGVPALDHVRHLVVHGMLHLLGYDHEADEQAERMEALETEILAGMGIADPYAH